MKHRIFYSPDDNGGSAPSGDSAPAPSILSGSPTPPPSGNPPPAQGASGTPPAATPPAALSFDKIITQDGGLAENWQSVLPEALREEKSLKNIKTLEHFAKNYVNAQKAVGSDKIPLINEKSTPEERDAFFNRLGRPEKSDGYKISSKLPEGVTINPEQSKAFNNFAHKIGVTQAQYDALVQFDAARKISEAQTADADKARVVEEGTSKLQEKWGAAYEQKVGDARRAAQQFGGVERFNSMGMGNNPEFIEFLAEIGKSLGEDRMKGADAVQIPVDAKAKIDEVMGNKQHPYFLKEHPQHNSAVAEMDRLFKMAYPERK
jgi:hypothetical protein